MPLHHSMVAIHHRVHGPQQTWSDGTQLPQQRTPPSQQSVQPSLSLASASQQDLPSTQPQLVSYAPSSPARQTSHGQQHGMIHGQSPSSTAVAALPMRMTTLPTTIDVTQTPRHSTTHHPVGEHQPSMHTPPPVYLPAHPNLPPTVMQQIDEYILQSLATIDNHCQHKRSEFVAHEWALLAQEKRFDLWVAAQDTPSGMAASA